MEIIYSASFLALAGTMATKPFNMFGPISFFNIKHKCKACLSFLMYSTSL